MAFTTHKSDPMFHCKVSLENESFLERFKCTLIQPIRMLYLMVYHYVNQLSEIRKQINVEHVFMSANRLSKTSLYLADTFFGFEVIISITKLKIIRLLILYFFLFLF